MKNFYDVLNQYVAENQPNFGDGESVLAMLYEAYSECNCLDDGQIIVKFVNYKILLPKLSLITPIKNDGIPLTQ